MHTKSYYRFQQAYYRLINGVYGVNVECLNAFEYYIILEYILHNSCINVVIYYNISYTVVKCILDITKTHKQIPSH